MIKVVLTLTEDILNELLLFALAKTHNKFFKVPS